MVAQLIIELKSDLYLSRLVGLARYLAECSVADIRIGRSELNAIQRVKRFQTDLQVRALPELHWDLLEQRRR